MSKKVKIPLLILGALVACFLVFLIVIGIGLYGFKWQNNFSNKAAEMLYFPAAYVDGKLVSFKEWKNYVRELKYQQDKAMEYEIEGSTSYTIDELNGKSLDYLVEQKLVERLAKASSVTVSQEEIDSLYNTEILPQATSESEIEENLQDLFGWSVSDFKTKVLKEYILREKLAEKVENNDLDAALEKAHSEKRVYKFVYR